MSKKKAVAISALVAGITGTLVYFFPGQAVAIASIAALIPSPLATLLTRDSDLEREREE